MNIKVVKSIYEYIDYISMIANNHLLWYRGQSQAQYRLIPGIIRNAVAVEDWAGRAIEPYRVNFSNGNGEKVKYPNYWTMLSDFKQKVSDILDVQPQNDIAWLCLAQHYGLPTPLLDWSTDPLVALFFAVNNAPTDYRRIKEIYGEDFEVNYEELSLCCAAVYIIDPLVLNEPIKNLYGIEGILDINKDSTLIEMCMESEMATPFCIYGLKTDKRMCRQSGNFTVHSHLIWPIDYIEYFRKTMTKVLIPFAVVSEIKRILRTIDLTEESIYLGIDEKDKYARKISQEYNEAFKKDYKSLF